MPSKKQETNKLRLLPMRVRPLPCKLTEEELLSYGQELSEIIGDISSEEERQDSVRQEHKAALKQLESRKTVLSHKISRQSEDRDVDVQPEMDFVKYVYRETRTDTGDVVFERPLTEEERQEPLDLN